MQQTSHLRRFVIVGHNATTAGTFSLNDLAGATGRLDVLLRCVNSALFTSHGIRQDTEVRLLLLGQPNAPKTITLKGREIKHLNPDERSTAALLKEALNKPIFGNSVGAGPGISVSRAIFKDILADAAKDSKLIALKEDGTDIRAAGLAPPLTFFLSDNRDFSDDELQALKDAGATFISLGPKSLLASHCVVIAHNEIDRTQIL
ncbi:MAG: tRNA (pseudouridine(54)-N(1))-methyltransferase TrmY [Candidatus Thermoplasmatota archaeon]|nr:tRNA (pseudouridine(54)-N(1))-methyltransferase TrmY [Candidatus Thermoplasmatota archaeon]